MQAFCAPAALGTGIVQILKLSSRTPILRHLERDRPDWDERTLGQLERKLGGLTGCDGDDADLLRCCRLDADRMLERRGRGSGAEHGKQADCHTRTWRAQTPRIAKVKASSFSDPLVGRLESLPQGPALVS